MKTEHLGQVSVSHKIHRPGVGAWRLAALVLLLIIASAAGALAESDANAGNTGEPVDIKSFLVRGKTTVIDFYSPFCGPCVQLSPLLERLAAKRHDLAVCRININRPQVRGIDWKSPLARQYKLQSVPHFVIFSPKGKILLEGRPAAQQLESWLREAGII